MFKRIEKWLEAKQDAAKQEQYDNGFGYAATQILKYGNTLDYALASMEFDPDSFDSGVKDAGRAITKFQDKAKKLDRVEAENKDLREIVQSMQKELGRLLVQLDEASKPQALSDAPAEKPKLPFKLEELPDWAEWVAQDANGHWYAYSNQPTTEWKNRENCYPNRWNVSYGGKCEFLYDGDSNQNWKSTLLKVKPEKAKPKLPFDVSILPEWANWVAQDEDGEWYIYEKRPYQRELQWLADSTDRDAERICRTEVVGDWRDTLYEIPKRES